MKCQFLEEYNNLTSDVDYVIFQEDPDEWICRTQTQYNAQLITDALNFYSPKGLHNESKNQIIE